MPRSESRQRVLVGSVLAAASAGIALQGRINGELVNSTGNPLEVGVLNVIAGIALGSIIMAATAGGRAGFGRLLVGIRSRDIRWWEMLGGIAGIALVTLQSAAVAVIGVAAFTVALVAGQTTSGALMDRFGWATGQRTALTAARIAAMVLAVLAVAVAALGRFGGAGLAGGLALLLVALSVLGGGASSVQSSLNGRVSRTTHQPLVAAWVSFVGSGIIGMPALAVLVAAGGASLQPIDRPWLLLAGCLGLVYVMAAAWSVRPLGLLVSAVLTVVGSLGGALVMDTVAPVPGATVTWHIVAGTLLALGAAGLSAFGRRAAPLPPR